MDKFKTYVRRPEFGELRPYIPGEELEDTLILHTPKLGDMVERHRKHPGQQRIVTQEYFEEMYLPVPEEDLYPI